MDSNTIYFDIAKDGLTSAGDFQLQEDEYTILESVENVVSTEPRSRIFAQRDFGTPLRQFLFEPLDTTTALTIVDVVTNAVNQWIPRAKNVDVGVTPREDLNTFIIEVTFTTDKSDRILKVEDTLERLR